jgi:phage terminase large subunit-like protein
LRRSRRKIDTYYPDTGPLRRELYVPHQKFFSAGATYRERLLIAANRIGKSEGVGAYEISCHLTGQYPAWWVGKRFSHPVKVWAAGDTGKTVKEILQAKLLGDPGRLGTGMIPGDAIVRTTSKGSVPDAIDTAYVKHVSGGQSALTLKSYEQGRESFQGSEQDVIWLDEEPPLPIYTECLIRTMTTGGCVLCTFTPLNGLTDVVLMFLPGGKLAAGESQDKERARRYVVTATWDDAPHLSDEVKQELWHSIPPYQRDARSKGVPQLGSGAIYPVPESEIVCADFPIPDNWPRAYGMDVGWNRTAGIWGAQHPISKVIYLYSEHYQGREEPSIHAAAFKARGSWIPGVIDPAARGRGQKDGSQLFQDYRDLGLDLQKAVNAVDAGLLEAWQLMSGGQLKVFKSLGNWLSEFRLYRRDDTGKVVKESDHLMDATRYLVVSGRQRMITAPKDTSGINILPSFIGKWS